MSIYVYDDRWTTNYAYFSHLHFPLLAKISTFQCALSLHHDCKINEKKQNKTKSNKIQTIKRNLGKHIQGEKQKKNNMKTVIDRNFHSFRIKFSGWKTE